MAGKGFKDADEQAPLYLRTTEENEYFVLGDNRKASEDSRYENIGNIAKNRIIGKVWYRTKPVNTAGRIE